MEYFNGFCLSNEQSLFNNLLDASIMKNDYIVCGFSLGAIDAFEYALSSSGRIDKLILLSPCFFQNTNEKFKKLQLISFRQNTNKYINEFINNIQKPHITTMDKYVNIASLDEGFNDLKKLLYYVYDVKKLQILKDKGILLEIYLGLRDEIINTNDVKDFFMPYSDIYMINNASHLLQNAK